MRYLGLLFVLTFLACSSEDTGGRTGDGDSSGTTGGSGSGGSGTSSGAGLGVGVGGTNGSSSGDTCDSKVDDFAACDDDCQCWGGKTCVDVDPSDRGTKKLCTNPCGSNIECVGLAIECRDGYCQPE